MKKHFLKHLLRTKTNLQKLLKRLQIKINSKNVLENANEFYKEKCLKQNRKI